VPFAAVAAPGLPNLRSLQRPRGRAAPRPDRGAAVARVAVDTLGCDRGVAEVVSGALDATGGGEVCCLLCGPEAELRQQIVAGNGRLLIRDAPNSISNDEEPARAVRARPDASIVRAAKAVGDGDAQALVSAGSTGAALAASTLHIKRIPGVYRPAVAVQLPVPGRRLLLLDVGASADVRPEQLAQFGFMGAAFAQSVLGLDDPEVGILNVGSERGKGTELVRAAFDMLAPSQLNFIGNVEGDDLTKGVADVVVTDGFTGNVALKTMEGTLRTLTGAIRDRVASGTISKLGGVLIRSRLRGLREELDPEAVGGAYLLGLRSPVVICHGSSSRRAIANAIALARRGVEERIVERTERGLREAGIARGAAPAAAGRSPSVPAGSVEAR
jgi:glycerol-3-phosphate acyltransferase PlsX